RRPGFEHALPHRRIHIEPTHAAGIRAIGVKEDLQPVGGNRWAGVNSVAAQFLYQDRRAEGIGDVDVDIGGFAGNAGPKAVEEELPPAPPPALRVTGAFLPR